MVLFAFFVLYRFGLFGSCWCVCLQFLYSVALRCLVVVMLRDGLDWSVCFVLFDLIWFPLACLFCLFVSFVLFCLFRFCVDLCRFVLCCVL